MKAAEDALPTDCGVCKYHTNLSKECRRHAPQPGHDEEFVPALWNFTKNRDRCGAGSTTKERVRCDDCVHWYRPSDAPIKPLYGFGMPDGWWELSGYCTANAPSATQGESLRTFWKVTSVFEVNGAAGGCGDGLSVTALREAEEKKKA